VRVLHGQYIYSVQVWPFLCCSSVELIQLLIECRTNYHHNYSVHEGARTYYGGLPKYIQVGEHQFVEDRVVHMWISMMLVGW
jgi:hypothetical protein